MVPSIKIARISIRKVLTFEANFASKKGSKNFPKNSIAIFLLPGHRDNIRMFFFARVDNSINFVGKS